MRPNSRASARHRPDGAHAHKARLDEAATEILNPPIGQPVPVRRQVGNFQGQQGFHDARTGGGSGDPARHGLTAVPKGELGPKVGESAADPTLAWLLAVGGLIGLIAALVAAAEEMGLIPAHTDRVSCGIGFACEASAADPFGSPNPLFGIVGFTLIAVVGAVLTMGVALPRKVWLAVEGILVLGVVAAHWLVLDNLVGLGVLCPYCTLACMLLVPMAWFTTAHTLNLGWLPMPRWIRGPALLAARDRRPVLVGWYLVIFAALYLGGGWYERNPLPDGALIAVALITVATLAGAGLASRFTDKMGLWLSLASAMMMVLAVTDIVPEVWHESEEQELPLWLPAIALLLGFGVITYFTRAGCGHGHDEEPAPATGRHRRAKRPPGTAAFGGVGAAAALTAHRVLEGTTLALTPTIAVIAALLVHSASEGLALVALLHEGRRRIAPWLMVSVAAPPIGIVAATISPLPEMLVPILLALIGGVLLRTAVVGLRRAIVKKRAGESRSWQIATSAGIAAAFGLLLALGGGH